MKTMKKTFSIILAVAMLFAVCSNAFAVNAQGSGASYAEYRAAEGQLGSAAWDQKLIDVAGYADLGAADMVAYDKYEAAGGTKSVEDWTAMGADANYKNLTAAKQVQYDAYKAAGGTKDVSGWNAMATADSTYADLTAAQQVGYDAYNAASGTKNAANWAKTIEKDPTYGSQTAADQVLFDAYEAAGGPATAGTWKTSTEDTDFAGTTAARQAAYDNYKKAGGTKTVAEWLAAVDNNVQDQYGNPMNYTGYEGLSAQQQVAYDAYVAGVKAINDGNNITDPADPDYVATDDPATWETNGNQTADGSFRHTIDVDASTAGSGNTPLTGHDMDAYQIFDGKIDYSKTEPTISVSGWGDGIDGDALLTALKAAYNNGNPTVTDGKVTVTTPGTGGTPGTFEVSEALLARFAPADTATAFAARMGDFDSDGDGTNDLAILNAAETAELAKLLRQFVKPDNKVNLVEELGNRAGHYSALVPDGYWLVVDETNVDGKENDFASANIMKVVKDVDQKIKGSVPTVEKGVSSTDQSGNKGFSKDSATATSTNTQVYINGNLTDVSVADINDTQYFTLVGTTSNDLTKFDKYYYCFTDQLSPGLTLNAASVVVFAGETNVTEFFTITPTTDTAGASLKIECEDLLTATNSKGTKLAVSDGMIFTVYYNATLNDKAVIGGEGNKNEVRIEYSNNPDDDDHGESEPDDTSTFTFELDIEKVDDDGVKLSGANFVIYKTYQENNINYIRFAIIDQDPNNDIEDKTVIGWTAPVAYTTSVREVAVPGEATVLSTGEDGQPYQKIEVKGLEPGTYYARETKAPAGYSKLTEDIQFTIVAQVEKKADGTYDVTSLTLTNGENSASQNFATPSTDEEGIVTEEVRNTNDLYLPETGGLGTTIFYIAGSILVLGAGILLVSRRRIAVR